MKKDELVGVLKELLQDVLRARYDGAIHAKLARAHGYADGYMRALLDAGLVDRAELLRIVGEERNRSAGTESGTREIDVEIYVDEAAA